MPMMMASVMGGSQLFGSLMQGQASAAQAVAQKQQFEWAEFTRRMDTQVKNREIAKQNALRWQQNNNIATAANQARAEEEFWLRYNYDNETGAFSRQAKQANDQLASAITGKGINLSSQTAKQLLRQSLNMNKEAMVNKRISFGNRMLSAERKQANALASRNFGYNAHVAFMPGVDTSPDPGSIMQGAMMQGLVSGAAAGFGGYQSASLQNTQTQYMQNNMANTGGLGGGLGGDATSFYNAGSDFNPAFVN